MVSFDIPSNQLLIIEKLLLGGELKTSEIYQIRYISLFAFFVQHNKLLSSCPKLHFF
jgi:hypothetical protein